MRVLVCGSRTWTAKLPIAMLVRAMANGPSDNVLIHGDAPGADRMGGQSAGRQGVPVEVYPADWEKHGRKAGPIRNQQMLDEGRPDLVWAFVDKPLAESRGTSDMVRRARAAGLKVYVTEEID
jgi:hypothetical protein